MEQVKAKANPIVVKMLEDLLEDAKSGEIQGIAIAGAMSNARTFNCYELGGYAMAMVGEMVVLQRDILDTDIDLRIKPGELL